MDERIMTFVINSLAITPREIAQSLQAVKFRRFFVDELKAVLHTSGQRIFIVAGLRGTGKTTALYQLFTEADQENIAYFSCDEFASREIALEDVISTLDVIKKENIGMGKSFLLLLDEITYLEKWDLKLKVLRDRRPNLLIVATSSSSLPLKKTVELARRSLEIRALPLSFREYLNLKYGISFQDGLIPVLRRKLGRESFEAEYIQVLSALGNQNLFGLYEEYMRHDLPSAFGLNDLAYSDAVVKTVKRTIYEDFPKYEKLDGKLLIAAESLIKYLSTIPADGVKISTLSEVIGISKESVVKLLEIFELAMVIKGIEYSGRNRMFKKPKKWFFYSSSMRRILAAPVSSESDMIGNMREDSVFRHLDSLHEILFYSHEADFIADGMSFEVGGKQKKKKGGVVVLSMAETIAVDRVPLPLFALCV